MKRQSESVKGNRAFYWTNSIKGIGELKHPLCLQSKEYNKEGKGLTWVYFSKSDAKRLLKFLQSLEELKCV